MAVQITGRDGKPKQKPFSWSYSRLKNFEVCPKRSYHIDILPKGHPDKVVEPEGHALKWGNLVHDKMAARCGVNRTPLPQEVAMYEPWAERVLVGGGEVIVEQMLAINDKFQIVDKFAPDAWFRTKVDFMKIDGDVGLVVDWKTGKIGNTVDSVQLALTAAVMFLAFPQLQAIRSSYIWLAEDAEGSENFKRSDLPTIWRNVWPRIEALKAAHLSTNYPAIKSGICKRFCPVKQCPYNGAG